MVVLTQKGKHDVEDLEEKETYTVLTQKGKHDVEDLEEKETYTDISYRCRLFVGEDPPLLVTTGRLYPGELIIHIVPMHDNFTRMMVPKVKDVNVSVSLSTMEVQLVGETLGTFFAQPTQLIMAI